MQKEMRQTIEKEQEALIESFTTATEPDIRYEDVTTFVLSCAMRRIVNENDSPGEDPDEVHLRLVALMRYTLFMVPGAKLLKSQSARVDWADTVSGNRKVPVHDDGDCDMTRIAFTMPLTDMRVCGIFGKLADAFGKIAGWRFIVLWISADVSTLGHRLYDRSAGNRGGNIGSAARTAVAWGQLLGGRNNVISTLKKAGMPVMTGLCAEILGGNDGYDTVRICPEILPIKQFAVMLQAHTVKIALDNDDYERIIQNQRLSAKPYKVTETCVFCISRKGSKQFALYAFGGIRKSGRNVVMDVSKFYTGTVGEPRMYAADALMRLTGTTPADKFKSVLDAVLPDAVTESAVFRSETGVSVRAAEMPHTMTIQLKGSMHTDVLRRHVRRIAACAAYFASAAQGTSFRSMEIMTAADYHIEAGRVAHADWDDDSIVIRLTLSADRSDGRLCRMFSGMLESIWHMCTDSRFITLARVFVSGDKSLGTMVYWTRRDLPASMAYRCSSAVRLAAALGIPGDPLADITPYDGMRAVAGMLRDRTPDSTSKYFYKTLPVSAGWTFGKPFLLHIPGTALKSGDMSVDNTLAGALVRNVTDTVGFVAVKPVGSNHCSDTCSLYMTAGHVIQDGEIYMIADLLTDFSPSADDPDTLVDLIWSLTGTSEKTGRAVVDDLFDDILSNLNESMTFTTTTAPSLRADDTMLLTVTMEPDLTSDNNISAQTAARRAELITGIAARLRYMTACVSPMSAMSGTVSFMTIGDDAMDFEMGLSYKASDVTDNGMQPYSLGVPVSMPSTVNNRTEYIVRKMTDVMNAVCRNAGMLMTGMFMKAARDADDTFDGEIGRPLYRSTWNITNDLHSKAAVGKFVSTVLRCAAADQADTTDIIRSAFCGSAADEKSLLIDFLNTFTDNTDWAVIDAGSVYVKDGYKPLNRYEFKWQVADIPEKFRVKAAEPGRKLRSIIVTKAGGGIPKVYLFDGITTDGQNVIFVCDKLPAQKVDISNEIVNGLRRIIDTDRERTSVNEIVLELLRRVYGYKDWRYKNFKSSNNL